MPTSSITKNFVVEGHEQVEKFANAIEESCNDPRDPVSVNATRVRGIENVRKLMEKRQANI